MRALFRRWFGLRCMVGVCGGFVNSDAHSIWWECGVCGCQKHKGPRAPVPPVVDPYEWK